MLTIGEPVLRTGVSCVMCKIGDKTFAFIKVIFFGSMSTPCLVLSIYLSSVSVSHVFLFV